jgi:hypothetical protein
MKYLFKRFFLNMLLKMNTHSMKITISIYSKLCHHWKSNEIRRCDRIAYIHMNKYSKFSILCAGIISSETYMFVLLWYIHNPVGHLLSFPNPPVSLQNN